jgi:hypothetical protein
MKLDREHKTQKLGSHIPGFVGYGAVHHVETDLLLRRYLAAKIGEVRDRLADFIAAGRYPEELRQKLAFSLRTAAFLKEEVAPPAGEARAESGLAPLDEERLLDFDLVLLDKVAALHSQLDLLEAMPSPEAMAEAIDLFDEGLAEVDDLFQERRRLLRSPATLAP